jgi:hypothetical protein
VPTENPAPSGATPGTETNPAATNAAGTPVVSGRIDGGLEFVWGAYGITWLGLLLAIGYALWKASPRSSNV